MHRPPDVVWSGNALEDAEEPARKRLGAERDPVDPASRRRRASAGVTVSGLASTVTSTAGGSAARSVAAQRAGREGRRSAADEHRLDDVGEDARSCASSARTASA